eukprot:6752397-Prymnesium_polylepis.1
MNRYLPPGQLCPVACLLLHRPIAAPRPPSDPASPPAPGQRSYSAVTAASAGVQGAKGASKQVVRW